MLETLQPVVQDFVSTVATGLLAILSGFLIAAAKQGFNFLIAKTQSVKDEKLRNDVTDAMSKLSSIVITTVTSLQQTLGDDIKESILNDDGVYTKEDLYALKDQAFETIKHQLTSSTLQVLGVAYEDVDDIIKDMIETAVRNLKTTEVLTTGEVLSISDDTSETESEEKKQLLE